MITNLCFGLTCLLIPLSFMLWNWQAALQLSNTGHLIVEGLIICGTFWLLEQILRLDEQLYYRYFLEHRDIPNTMNRQVRIDNGIARVQQNRTAPTEPLNTPAFHGLRMQFGNLLKNHRGIKPR